MGPTKPLVFLHIPKTAGLTMHEILNDQYPGNSQKIIYSEKFTHKYTDLPIEKKRKIDIIKGHVVYGIHTQMPLEPTYFTMLRKPFNRTVSGYEFIRSYKPHPFHRQMLSQNYTLHEFLAQKLIRNFDNNHVRYLSASTHLPFGEITREHFETAKKNLMGNNMLFGITEFFDESVIYFKCKLGWTTPWYEKVNVNTKKVTDIKHIDDKTSDLIRQCNLYDDQLYDFALNEFKKRIEDLGDSFKNEVLEFKAGNKGFSAKRKFFLFFRKKYFTFIQSRFF